ncbi:MAG: PmoA family protein [Planctomycetes bacterium]|nr:PmoA family protein [Planctomycetota bacterium]
MKHAAIVLLLALPQQSASFQITVDAGKHDRKNTVVSLPVTLPAASAGATTAILEDGSGKTLQGQIASGRELRFILPELKAGQSASFKVTFIREADKRDEIFAWNDSAGDFAELSLGKRPLLRYMYKPLDESSKAARDETFKIFHHLYDPKGERFVTKGTGGLFPHHRGIFYGFNKVTYGENKKCDVWHCTGDAYQSHEKFLLAEAGPVYGRHRLAIAWHGVKKEVFASEERDLTVYSLPGGTLVEFVSEVSPLIAPVVLDGDPQHAGFHFRASADVSEKTKGQTYYLRPDGQDKFGATRNWPGQKTHVNLPWDAMSFVVADTRYTVAYLDRPDNPKEARFSERDYGRFGSYFEKTLQKDDRLSVRYRVWLQEGEMKGEDVARLSADFLDPPKVTVK